MASQTYQDRNDTLKFMGYASYAEYLASPLWTSIREKVYKYKGTKCVLCNKDATCVHHRGYGLDTLEGTNLTPLVPLCNGCHMRIEFKSKGDKRSLKGVERSFNSMLKSRVGSFKGKPDRTKRELFGFCKVCGHKGKRGKNYCSIHKGYVLGTGGKNVRYKCKCGNDRKQEKEICGRCARKKRIQNTTKRIPSRITMGQKLLPLIAPAQQLPNE